MFFNIFLFVLEVAFTASTASDFHDFKKDVRSWMKKHSWGIRFKKDGSPRFRKLL